MSLQPNDAGQVPRCACGARILTPPDTDCPLCAMLANGELKSAPHHCDTHETQGARGFDGTESPTREP